MISDLSKLSKALISNLPEEVLIERLRWILEHDGGAITASLKCGKVYVDNVSGLKISSLEGINESD